VPTPLPTSRAYWNLRAEQVMDRVFSDGERSLEAVHVQLDPVPPESDTPTTDAGAGIRAKRWWLLAMAGPVLVSMGVCLWLARNWQATLTALNRERDLQLIERVRSLPAPVVASHPDGKDPKAPRQQATTTSSTATASTEFRLPASLKPVTIPVPQTPQPDAAQPATTPAATLPEPLLVGVVHAGGGRGSAIFRLDQLSFSAVPGEQIGNSGWRLKSVQASGAVIERQGQQRNLSVGGAF
jgi:hypothetical protein